MVMLSAKLCVASFIGVLYAVSAGLALGYSSSAAFQVFLTVEWSAVFASCLNIGGLIGSLTSGYFLSHKGRRWTLLCSCFPGVIGWIWLYISADNVYERYSPTVLFIFGRILTGVSTGMVIPSCATYLIEISPASLHGVYGTMPQLGIVSGITIAYTLAAVLPWERIAILNAAFMLILLIVTGMLPDSPKWLAKSGHLQLANAAHTWLYGSVASFTEFEELKPSEEGSIQANAGVRDYLFPYGAIPSNQRSKLHVAMVLMVLQQLTGVNAVLYFAESVCMLGGSTWVSTCTILMGASQVVFTIVAAFLINRISRKRMLQWSAIIMCISHFMHSIILTAGEPFALFHELGKVCVIFFLLGFSIGWGPLPILVTMDLFTTAHRGFASSTAVAINWIASFVVTALFEPLSAWYGSAVSFWIFSFCCLVACLFTNRYIPESFSVVESH